MDFPKQTLDLLRDLLVTRKQTLAVAESVTSGFLQAALSNATDAALFFQGGITAYNLGQKCRHLNVEPIHALDCDCVSENVSAQMAREVCRLFRSDFGIGVTGYATPVPEKNIHELYCYLCIAHNDSIVLSRKIIPGKAKALEAQVQFTNSILAEFAAFLQTAGHPHTADVYTFV